MDLKELLAEHTMPAAAELTRTEEDGRLRCVACGHRCAMREGRHGVCRVRFVRDGELRAPGGYVSGLQVDPIEKKPFFHAFPARDALSFGMLGCDLHCSYCQNWVSSQTLRDEQAVTSIQRCDAARLAEIAVQENAPAIVSTYTEPLITADWAAEVFSYAKKAGLTCGFVSNGNATPEVLEYLRPLVDLYKVDLKCFNDKNYRKLGGTLQAVLESIERLKAMAFWVEAVTLVVPGFNDSDEELGQIASFLAGVSVDIPWHVTAFHPDYKMTDPPRTPVSTLVRAVDAGKSAGLRYVYAGNIAGQVGDFEKTYCHGCGAVLIRRRSFTVLENRMAGKTCPDCGVTIPGVWEEDPPRKTGGLGMPRRL